MYTCLAAVLFVTNIEFLESSVGGLGEEQTDGVIIDDEYPLHTSKNISGYVLINNYIGNKCTGNDHPHFPVYHVFKEIDTFVEISENYLKMVRVSIVNLK